MCNYLKMENNMEDKKQQDVMVSNLPLLFSDGKPVSLSSMQVVSTVRSHVSLVTKVTIFFITGGSTVLCTISCQMYVGV